MEIPKDTTAASIHVVTFDQAYQALRNNNYSVKDKQVMFGASLEALGKCTDQQVADIRKIQQEMIMNPIEKFDENDGL
ncbi:MAG: hypothetical protein CMH22_04950 [Methylophaga sp.]|nr:hypothetical protein [Methylophaga sp.]|tara:strand:+ start:41967 stop:42200 length:234 start_codon:yes stop_codon:yes gene_type:complete